MAPMAELPLQETLSFNNNNNNVDRICRQYFSFGFEFRFHCFILLLSAIVSARGARAATAHYISPLCQAAFAQPI